jgi:Tfp pilus assembly protein PilE
VAREAVLGQRLQARGRAVIDRPLPSGRAEQTGRNDVRRQAIGASGDRERGFVLSELVLVVVVVGILLVVIVASVNGIHDSTAVGRCQTQVRTLKTASEQFAAENNKYPISKKELLDKDLIQPDDAPDYRLRSGGPAERPQFVGSGDCA